MAFITKEDMQEGKFTLKPLTAELSLSVGQNLRLDDRREVEDTTGWTAEAVCVQGLSLIHISEPTRPY